MFQLIKFICHLKDETDSLTSRYLELANDCHPDKDPNKKLLFELYTMTYELLKNNRKEYDMMSNHNNNDVPDYVQEMRDFFDKKKH